MVVDVALYTVVHQPRRLKLPAQPIPRCASIEDITRCLFDERLNERYFHQVAQSCYYPAVHMFSELVQQQGLRLALGISLSFVRQAKLWDTALLDLFRELVAEENVELIGVEPYQSLLGLIDLPAFAMRMRRMADEMQEVFGKRPVIADMLQQGMSTSLYNALDTAGFQGILMSETSQIMQWRSSTYLYQFGQAETDVMDIKLSGRSRRHAARAAARDPLGPPYTTEALHMHSPYLLTCHAGLSADIRERFSDHSWASYPLYAETYASWVARTEGDFVLLTCDIETFGERHAPASGIFNFIRAFPGALKSQGMTLRTPGELIERHAASRTFELPLPIHPPTWSAALDANIYFDQGPQRAHFQLMHDVYNLARLTENAELLDLATWLTQIYTLHLVTWPEQHIAHAATPREWWSLGSHDILHAQRQVYLNLLYALEPYLPTRIQRQTLRKQTRSTQATIPLKMSQEAQDVKEIKEKKKPQNDKILIEAQRM